MSYAVADVLPHAEPMVLLDRITDSGEDWLQAELEITSACRFATEQGIPAWLGLEYMGQAIAAFAGVRARQRQEPVKIGFLVSSRRYECALSHFPFGMLIGVHIREVTASETGLQVFECALSSAGEELVKANLNVFLPEDATEFIEGSS